MADVLEEIAGEDDSSSKLREARQRRIEIRRASSVAGETPAIGYGTKREADVTELLTSEKRKKTAEPDTSASGSPPSSSSGGGEGGSEVPAVAESLRAAPDPVADPPVLFGSVALSGRSREMEDAVSLRPGFFRPAGGSPLHLFAVFDGHGGSHVSTLCMERMHVLVAEELTVAPPKGEGEEERLKSALMRAFGHMDELALISCACGRVSDPQCRCERSGFESDIVGSTAVVAIVGPRLLCVANCGDSRAVLCRGGQALPLSTDHKPDRPDELARIEAAGGRVIHLNGARVDGILAMSRAIGDKYFKPVVISEPEICVMERHPQDECLVIASDGLWDVIPNNLACDVARRCLMEGKGNLVRGSGEVSSGATESATDQPESRCSLAANLLARLAMGRKSADNISAIVIDLRSG